MSDEWIYKHDGREYGPVSLTDLRAALQLGLVTPTDLVRRRIVHGWAAAETFPELRSSPPSAPGADSSDSLVPRRAFTLVELLVVIAIIGTLAGLLLSAVQAAREAARQNACVNNLKQQVTAVLNYESSRKQYPLGGGLAPAYIAQLTSPKNSRVYAHGISWMAEILPFLEESAIYNQLDRSSRTSPHTGMIYWAGNTFNGGLLAGVPFPTYWCPSSTLRRWDMADWGDARLTTQGACNPHYTGIAGAADPALITRRPELFVTDDTIVPHNLMGWGIKASSGVLVNDLIERGDDTRVVIRAQQVTDGTSKTLVLGEHSDFMTTNGRRVDRWGTSQGHSFIMGHFGHETRQWNIVTVRHAINDRRTENTGVGDENLYYGANKPLVSPHPGGVNGAFADGSVRWLSDSTSTQVLWNACNRADGNDD